MQDVIDYSGLEPDGLFLEGTGAMVMDLSAAQIAHFAGNALELSTPTGRVLALSARAAAALTAGGGD